MVHHACAGITYSIAHEVGDIIGVRHDRMLFELVPDLTRSWRILTHPDRSRTPAVAAFFDFIAHQIAAPRPILTG